MMHNTIDVLIVDDCDADAELTMLALRKAAQPSKLLRLKDGDQALQFILRRGWFQARPAAAPRLILLDIEMPMIGGLGVLEGIRNHAETRNIPIVMLSASDNPLTIARSLELGAREYVVKPTQYDAYVACVTRIVENWLQPSMDPRTQDQSELEHNLLQSAG